MRVGIIALLQESNTFLDRPTTIEHFQQDLLALGEAVRRRLADAHHEVGGFFEGLSRAGIEAVPIFAARALPFGTMTSRTLARLMETMFAELDRAGPLDGILAAAHGATVSRPHGDVDGHWLGELRRRVGPKIPIVCTLDLHGNLSRGMIEACDASIAYRTNPHLDQRQCGLKASSLMARTLDGRIRPTQAAAMPPLAINIERQLTSAGPCRALFESADGILDRPGVLSNSILLGFPFADVQEMGAAAVVVTDDDLPLAQRLAGELGQLMWSRREDFLGQLIGIEEALELAAKSDGPICLLDMGDNVGGGSPGDGTHLLSAIVRGALGETFVCLYDPESVDRAAAAGVGRQVRLAVGGKTDQAHGPPWEATFTVLSLHDGKFEEPEARHGGFTTMDQGATAVVRWEGGLTVMLTSRRMPPFSLRQLTSFGLVPASFRIIVAKGVHAPVAAYEPVCRRLIRVDTPGVTTADMTRLRFTRRRRPMFPFEADTTWRP